MVGGRPLQGSPADLLRFFWSSNITKMLRKCDERFRLRIGLNGRAQQPNFLAFGYAIHKTSIRAFGSWMPR